MNYYTSDLHLFCNGVLQTGRFKERPFTSLEEMHSEIKERWNRKVTNADHVYILGDIAMRGIVDLLTAYLSQLKGNLHWIVGNHDTPNDFRLKKQFVEICPYKELSDNFGGKSYRLILSHYPIFAWNGQTKGTIHLYGHTHDNLDDVVYQKSLENLREMFKAKDGDKYVPFYAFNVGCMLWDFEPVSLQEILEKKGIVEPVANRKNEKLKDIIEKREREKERISKEKLNEKKKVKDCTWSDDVIFEDCEYFVENDDDFDDDIVVNGLEKEKKPKKKRKRASVKNRMSISNPYSGGV